MRGYLELSIYIVGIVALTIINYIAYNAWQWHDIKV